MACGAHSELVSGLPGYSLLLELFGRPRETRELVMRLLPPALALLREVCKAANNACSDQALWETLVRREDGVSQDGLGILDARCLYRRLRLREVCGFELIARGEKRIVQPNGSVTSAMASGVSIDALNPFDRPCWLLFAEATAGGLLHRLAPSGQSSRVHLTQLDEAAGLRCRGFRSAAAVGELTRGNATARALGTRGEVVLLELALVVEPPGAPSFTLPVFGLLLPPGPPLGKAPTFRGQCRYCLDEDDGLIAPCECTGSAQLVHRGCLQRWQRRRSLEGRDHRRCEICKAEWLVQLDALDREGSASSVLTMPRSALLQEQCAVCDRATITIGKHCLENRAPPRTSLAPERLTHKSNLLELETVLCVDLLAINADGAPVALDGAAASVDLSSDPGVAIRSTLDGPVERNPFERRSRKERAGGAACAETVPFPWRSRVKGAFNAARHEITGVGGGTLLLGTASELRMTVLRTMRMPATVGGIRGLPYG